jgi:hypothetical protein
MKALSDNLYFKNLDNNAGVFYHLVDAAKQQLDSIWDNFFKYNRFAG